MEPQAVTGLVQYGALGIICLILVGAVVALWRAFAAKEAAHRSERKEDRDAHLAALEKLGLRVDGTTTAVRDVAKAQDETTHQLERLNDRLPLAARGSATIATLVFLLVLAAVAFIATSCTHRVNTSAQLHATVDQVQHDQVEQQQLEQHQVRDAQASTFERKREQGPRHMVDHTHTVRAPAPGAPVGPGAYVTTTDRTRTEDDGVIQELERIDQQLAHADDSAAAQQKVEQRQGEEHAATAAVTKTHSETRAGLGLDLVVGIVVLALIGGAWAYAFGPRKALGIVVGFFTRIFNRRTST